jgi:hypothetical protein
MGASQLLILVLLGVVAPASPGGRGPTKYAFIDVPIQIKTPLSNVTPNYLKELRFAFADALDLHAIMVSALDIKSRFAASTVVTIRVKVPKAMKKQMAGEVEDSSFSQLLAWRCGQHGLVISQSNIAVGKPEFIRFVPTGAPTGAPTTAPTTVPIVSPTVAPTAATIIPTPAATKQPAYAPNDHHKQRQHWTRQRREVKMLRVPGDTLHRMWRLLLRSKYKGAIAMAIGFVAIVLPYLLLQLLCSCFRGPTRIRPQSPGSPRSPDSLPHYQSPGSTSPNHAGSWRSPSGGSVRSPDALAGPPPKNAWR